MKKAILPDGTRIEIEGTAYVVRGNVMLFILPNGQMRQVECATGAGAAIFIADVDTFVADTSLQISADPISSGGLTFISQSPSPAAAAGDVITITGTGFYASQAGSLYCCATGFLTVSYINSMTIIVASGAVAVGTYALDYVYSGGTIPNAVSITFA